MLDIPINAPNPINENPPFGINSGTTILKKSNQCPNNIKIAIATTEPTILLEFLVNNTKKGTMKLTNKVKYIIGG